MFTATLSPNGKITIPEEVRTSLRLEEGSRLSFRVREDQIVEMQRETIDGLSLCGIFKPKVRGVTIEEMNAAILKAGA